MRLNLERSNDFPPSWRRKCVRIKVPNISRVEIRLVGSPSLCAHGLPKACPSLGTVWFCDRRAAGWWVCGAAASALPWGVAPCWATSLVACLYGNSHCPWWVIGARRYRVHQESTVGTLFRVMFWGRGIAYPTILEDRAVVGSSTVPRALLLEEMVTAVLYSLRWNLCPVRGPLWVFPLSGSHGPFGLSTFGGSFLFIPLWLSRWPWGLPSLGLGWAWRGVGSPRTFVSLLPCDRLVDLPCPEQSVLT